MKKLMMASIAMLLMTNAFGYSRSVPLNTSLSSLNSEHKVLITEDLEVNRYTSLIGNLVEGNEAMFGAWCYLHGEDTFAAGTILRVLDVDIEDTAGKFKDKWITITLENSCEIKCLRMSPENLKVRRVEKLLNGNIKFIK